MPLKLHQVKRKQAPFTLVYDVDGGKESLSGTYNVAAYTPQFVSQLRNMDSEDPLTLARLVAGLIVSWDLAFSKEDADAGFCDPKEVGKACPLTVEFLSGLPVDFLAAILGAVRTEAKPDPNSTAQPGSGVTSSLEDEEGPVLTNTD